jgi:hypothetical protein
VTFLVAHKISLKVTLSAGNRRPAIPDDERFLAAREGFRPSLTEAEQTSRAREPQPR